jgi:hypothetical protein
LGGLTVLAGIALARQGSLRPAVPK